MTTKRTDALTVALHNNAAEAAAFGTPKITPEEAYEMAFALAVELESEVEKANALSANYLASIKGVVADHNRIERELAEAQTSEAIAIANSKRKDAELAEAKAQNKAKDVVGRAYMDRCIELNAELAAAKELLADLEAKARALCRRVKETEKEYGSGSVPGWAEFENLCAALEKPNAD
jgi:chromosome segregation ATPase